MSAKETAGGAILSPAALTRPAPSTAPARPAQRALALTATMWTSAPRIPRYPTTAASTASAATRTDPSSAGADTVTVEMASNVKTWTNAGPVACATGT